MFLQIEAHKDFIIFFFLSLDLFLSVQPVKVPEKGENCRHLPVKYSESPWAQKSTAGASKFSAVSWSSAYSLDTFICWKIVFALITAVIC